MHVRCLLRRCELRQHLQAVRVQPDEVDVTRRQRGRQGGGGDSAGPGGPRPCPGLLLRMSDFPAI
jgi:hypothetical protein